MAWARGHYLIIFVVVDTSDQESHTIVDSIKVQFGTLTKQGGVGVSLDSEVGVGMGLQLSWSSSEILHNHTSHPRSLGTF